MVMPDLVDPVQSAFVQGRRISDNIFLSQELMRGYHRTSSSPRCAMKVDIMKASDNVRWDFMIDVLKVMDFPHQFIHWIQACMTSPSFSICINDSLQEGIFLLPMLLRRALMSSKLYLAFLLALIKVVFFSGCEKKLRDEVMGILKFPEGFLPVRYLGVPLISTKLKASECLQLVEKITKRIKCWTNKCLSFAGRLQLIQSILFSMQVYWSSLFILPKKVVKDIEGVFRAFLWFGSELKKYGAKVSWDKVCSPKKGGDLGLKSMGVWNKAVIAKHIWFLFSGGERSMWCQWVKSYLLKGRSFWKVKVPTDSSWVWRKILGLRPIIYPYMKYSVGDGNSVFFWFDNWHPLGSLWAKFGDRIMYDTAVNFRVSRINSNSSWRWPTSIPVDICDLIQSTPQALIPRSSPDKLMWTLSTDGLFSIKSAWNAWRVSFEKVEWSNLVWSAVTVPKASFITWLAIQNRLNMGDRLKLFGKLVYISCWHSCREFFGESLVVLMPLLELRAVHFGAGLIFQLGDLIIYICLEVLEIVSGPGSTFLHQFQHISAVMPGEEAVYDGESYPEGNQDEMLEPWFT
ncbi:uncharacterized protein LOC114261825 [Camellia sinensis]|uniref:uncharacterized protein LOC114261825 n=1 Tax=Camellia sinensis TaxID=4442 RepID=UPI001036EA66|nr:uncharacterized protein LOC114261825 [Camellia sinensis]